MQEGLVLRELTDILNLPPTATEVKQTTPMVETGWTPLEELLSVSHQEVDFGLCIPGSIHERTISVKLLRDLDQKKELRLCIISQDEALDEYPELVFGVNLLGQREYYDDYRVMVQKKGNYTFRVGVKTPQYYSYLVKNSLSVKLADCAPYIVNLQQTAQVPQIVCPRELSIEQSRVIKISVIQGKSKKQCRIPFKMNHNMPLSVTSEIIGLEYEKIPLLDVKPRAMTLTGMGPFSLVLSTGVNEEIRDCVALGKSYSVRRILTLTVKDTKFIYHFPLEVTYYPGFSTTTTTK